jgi:hypothetical protein
MRAETGNWLAASVAADTSGAFHQARQRRVHLMRRARPSVLSCREFCSMKLPARTS